MAESPDLRKTLGPVIAFGVSLYFCYHIFQGERGVLSWYRLIKVVQGDEKKLTDLQREKDAIEHRVKLLRPESLDLDMLDEQARRLLNHGQSDETVIQSLPLSLPESKSEIS